MTNELKEILERWLGHERHGRQEAADRSFREMYRRSMPVLAPQPGFAERVLLEVGVTPDPLRISWSYRAVLACSLLLAGLAASVLPQTIKILSGLFDLGRLFDLGASSLIGISRWTTEGFVTWQSLADASRTVGLAVSTPPVLITLVVLILL